MAPRHLGDAMPSDAQMKSPRMANGAPRDRARRSRSPIFVALTPARPMLQSTWQLTGAKAPLWTMSIATVASPSWSRKTRLPILSAKCAMVFTSLRLNRRGPPRAPSCRPLDVGRLLGAAAVH
eukprot:9321194-Pyramimonas_sp.AAC.1